MWPRGKKLKSLVGFLSASKTNNYSRGKKEKKKIQKNCRTSEKIRINVFLESLLSESFPSLTSLGFPPTLCWSLDLLRGQLRFKSGPASSVSCLQCPQLSELECFLLWELSMAFYRFHRHRICLVDRVDLIWGLHTWWEGFGSSSLATLPLGFQFWSYLHLSMRVDHWGLLLRLPWRTRVCPSEGQAWKRCSCLGRRGSGSTRYSGGLAARAAGNTVL